MNATTERTQALGLEALKLRTRLRRITTLERLRACGVQKCKAELGVRVAGVEGQRHAHAVGLLTCNSVHACPTCARSIRARRMVQFSAALRGGLEAHPDDAWQMLSITFRHHDGMRLQWLRDGLFKAWRRCRQSGNVKRIFEAHVKATARAFEVTHGANGWHPHLHLAMLTDEWSEREKQILTSTFLRCFAAEVCTKIKGLVEKRNRKGVVRVVRDVIAWDVASYREWLAFFTEYSAHAIRWSEKKLTRGDGSNKLESYLTDIGLELSLGATKTTAAESSRTPWQIADAATRGDEKSKQLWWEYEHATKGTRCLELDDRAAAFAKKESAMRASDDVGVGELAGELTFENAPLVGEPSVYAELDPEMMGAVRSFERLNPLATKMWLEAARTTEAPLTAARIRDSVDACIRGMVESLAHEARRLGQARGHRPGGLRDLDGSAVASRET